MQLKDCLPEAREKIEEEENSMIKKLQINSFMDFILVKIYSNQYHFAEMMEVKNFKHLRRIFDDDGISVFVKIGEVSDWQQVEKLLHKAAIQISNAPKESTGLISFREFSEQVFSAPQGMSLLMMNHTLNECRDQLQKNLFSNDEAFRLTKLKRGNNFISTHYSTDSTFFIENTKATNLLAPDAFYQNDDLVKFSEKSITVNLHRFCETYINRCEERANNQTDKFQDKCAQKFIKIILQKDDVESLSSKDIDSAKALTFQHWALIGYYFKLYLKITTTDSKQLTQIINYFYEKGWEDCLEWKMQKSSSFIRLSASNMDELIVNARTRIVRDTMSLNLTHCGKIRFAEINFILTNLTQLASAQTFGFNHFQFIKTLLISKKYDLLSLQSSWGRISEVLTEIFRNWEMYEYDLRGDLKIIIKILEYKFYRFRVKTIENGNSKAESGKYFYLCEYLYPQIQHLIKKYYRISRESSLVDKFNCALEKQKSKNQRMIQIQSKASEKSQQEDIFYEILRNEKEELKLEENVLDKLLLDYFHQIDSLNNEKGHFYVKVQGYEKKPLKQFIGEVISYQLNIFAWEGIYNMITINTKKMLDRSVQGQITNFEAFSYPNTTCLACTQFFVLNKSIVNCPNRVPLRLFPFQLLAEMKNEIIEEIRRMLANTGGIILFSCEREYGSIMPKGTYITQVHKKQIENLLESWLQEINPKVELGKEVVLSFVPIVENARSKRLGENHENNIDQRQLNMQNLRPINNCFAMRLKVYTSQKAGETVEKKKVAQTAAIKQHNIKQSNKFTPRNPLNHKCRQVIVFENAQANLEKIFTSMSMLVIKEKYLPILKSKLEEMSLIFCIQTRFQDYGFSIAKYTAVLYHNNSFEEILKKVTNNPELIFEAKRVLAIFITEYLKIESGSQIKKSDIQNASLWLTKEFPDEALRFFELRDEEYVGSYIKTESKLSTLFLYYVFNHFKVKAVFKNPPESERGNLIEVPFRMGAGTSENVSSRRIRLI